MTKPALPQRSCRLVIVYLSIALAAVVLLSESPLSATTAPSRSYFVNGFVDQIQRPRRPQNNRLHESSNVNSNSKLQQLQLQLVPLCKTTTALFATSNTNAAPRLWVELRTKSKNRNQNSKTKRYGQGVREARRTKYRQSKKDRAERQDAGGEDPCMESSFSSSTTVSASSDAGSGSGKSNNNSRTRRILSKIVGLGKRLRRREES